MEKEVVLSEGTSHVLEQTSLVLHVDRDEQMVRGTRSEPVLNFPNLLDFRYQHFVFSVPVRHQFLPSNTGTHFFLGFFGIGWY
ncbi:hypothetical protein Hanom_Chr04g00357561 [Helianthus anomalus]